jgi:hypothetical protein
VDPAIGGLLRRVGRRVRAAWGLAWVQLLAPPVAVAALLLVLAGWLLPWPWTDWAAAGLVAALLLGVAVAALLVPVPLDAAARAADRGLGTQDALATSLEVPPEGEFGTRVQARARAAASAGARDAVRLPLGSWRLAMSGVLGIGALMLAVTHSPQDEARERRAIERAAVSEVTEELADDARTLATSRTELDQAVAAQLDGLATALEGTDDLDAAIEALARAEDELAAEVDADLLARKAATQGLDRSLTDDPLAAGGDGDAAEQLRQAATGLEDLAADEQAALAERLEQLAGAQELGAPEVAEALRSAAGALRAGNAQGATSALEEAAAAQAESATAVDQQQAAATAAARAGEARRALEQAGEPGANAAQGGSDAQNGGQSQSQQGQGQQDQGQGQQGQGQQDQGQGQQGQGQQDQGQGQGQGGGGGNPSGQVGGGGGSGNQGQGGTGRPSGGSGGSGDEPVEGSVFDPPAFGEGEELDAGGGTGTGDGRTVGMEDGQTAGGAARVPVADVIERYAQQATTAVDRPGVPPSVRDLVRAYFEQLAGGGSAGG